MSIPSNTPPLTIDAAVAVIRTGGIIAYPTEAVWGLGCDPFNEAATLQLLAIKQRPLSKGLILVAASLQQLQPLLNLAGLPAEKLKAVQANWPGPTTWVLPASLQAPAWIIGQHTGIAVRVSAHPRVIALCNALNGPLVSTSANLSNNPPPHTREQLDPKIIAAIDGILSGQTGTLLQPTPIRDALSGAILRY